MRLWQDPYEHHHTFPMEKWDDRLGMHTHEDGTLKAAGMIFRDISIMLRSVRFVSFDSETRTCVTENGIISAALGSPDTPFKGNSIYHMSGENCLAAMDMGSIKSGGCVLIAASNCEAYMYFYTDGLPFGSAPVIYFKAEIPGKYRFERKISKAELIEHTHSGVRIVDECAFASTSESSAEVFCDRTMTRYWMKLTCGS